MWGGWPRDWNFLDEKYEDFVVDCYKKSIKHSQMIMTNEALEMIKHKILGYKYRICHE